MASTGKSFDHIKAILGKLDRQVDEARTKRLGITPAPAGMPAVAPTRLGQAPEAPASPPSEARSKYGRARPLNRADEKANPWSNNSPPRTDMDETIG